MPNRNYIKGVRKERELVNAAREMGNIAFRSAGSHSPIDVVIIDKESQEIHFVQCKPDNFSHKKTEELMEQNKFLNDYWRCYFEVI